MKNESQMEAIVMGGGLAGIASALLLARSGRKVRIIEAAPELGGLLRSFENEDGVVFDYGTHIPKEIGIPGFDELLFGDLDPNEWQALDRLNVGGYFQGRMYPTSQFVDLRQLPEAIRNAAVYELLATAPNDEPSVSNAEEFSLAKYGRTLTNEVIEPLMQKLYGVGLCELQPSAIGLVGYSRFIGFDRYQTHEIKKSPFYDQKFGFTTWDDGISPLMNYYPNAGGIQKWIDGLIEKLSGFDVSIETNTKITAIRSSKGKIDALVTEAEEIEVNDLFWTVSPSLLLKLMGEPFPEGTTPPEFRSTALINFVFDRDFNTDLAFFYCHDIEKINYRTTIYSNLRSEGRRQPPFNCTVEVMADNETVESEDIADRVLNELRAMEVIGEDHKVTYRKVIASAHGFPLPTTGFGANSISLTKHCCSLVDNVTLLGRATGKTHFMHEVLGEIWTELTDADV